MIVVFLVIENGHRIVVKCVEPYMTSKHYCSIRVLVVLLLVTVDYSTSLHYLSLR
jgi:hypothetical protein